MKRSRSSVATALSHSSTANVIEVCTTPTGHVIATCSPDYSITTIRARLTARAYNSLHRLLIQLSVSFCSFRRNSLSLGLFPSESSRQLCLLSLLSFSNLSFCFLSSFSFYSGLFFNIGSTRHSFMVRDLARNAVRFLTLRAVKLGITSIILKWKVTARSNRTIPDSAVRSVDKATDRQ